MKTLTAFALVAVVNLGLGAGTALAQDDQPKTGKIGNVEREAREARRDGGHHGDDDDGGGGAFAFLHVVFGYPREPGQGYEPYPYRHADQPFVHDSVLTGRRFWTVSGQYFADDESTLRGGQFAFEGANGLFTYGIETTQFIERLAGETDRLFTARVMVGVLPPLGRIGFVRVGLAARGLVTDQGDAAGGPELELGVQLFPRRPFGLDATGRGAFMSWDHNSYFFMSDLQLGGSVFLGPLEMRAGYRRMQVGSATAFNGPTLGLRVWF
jgi:hypothetical protein